MEKIERREERKYVECKRGDGVEGMVRSCDSGGWKEVKVR